MEEVRSNLFRRVTRACRFWHDDSRPYRLRRKEPGSFFRDDSINGLLRRKPEALSFVL